MTYLAQQSAGAVRAFETLPAGRRLSNAIVSYVTYIGQMIWPANLAPLYPYAPGESLLRVAIAALALTGLTVLALRAPTRYAYATVGWLWYLGMLVPVIGLIRWEASPWQTGIPTCLS